MVNKMFYHSNINNSQLKLLIFGVKYPPPLAKVSDKPCSVHHHGRSLARLAGVVCIGNYSYSNFTLFLIKEAAGWLHDMLLYEPNNI